MYEIWFSAQIVASKINCTFTALEKPTTIYG